MKTLTLILAIAFSSMTFAATPYPPEINKRFKALEATTDLAAGTSGLQKMKVARVAFNSETMGTSSSTGYDLGATLPAKSILWDGMIYTTSGFSGTGSVAIECEDSASIKSQMLTSTLGATAGTSVALNMTGTAASSRAGIGAACAIQAKVTGDNVVGKFNAWIMYFVHD